MWETLNNILFVVGVAVVLGVGGWMAFKPENKDSKG